MHRIYVLLLILALAVGACKKEVDQGEVDRLKIEQYLSDQAITGVQQEASGLYYVIDEPGSGPPAAPGSRVRVKYKGYLLDGTVFDQTKEGQSAVFSLSGLIPGWQMAVPLLKPGGKGRFVLPSHLAYGAFSPHGPIGPNEVLVFEIELLEVTR